MSTKSHFKKKETYKTLISLLSNYTKLATSPSTSLFLAAVDSFYFKEDKKYSNSKNYVHALKTLCDH